MGQIGYSRISNVSCLINTIPSYSISRLWGGHSLSKRIDQQVVEKISRILAEQLTGSKITDMFSNLRMKDFDEERIIQIPQMSHTTKWQRLNETAIYEMNHAGGSPRPFFRIIQYVIQPANFVSRPKDWNLIRQSINSILIFYGFELGDDGVILQVEAVSTMSEALARLQTFSNLLTPLELHPQVMVYCTEELLHEDYFHAVFEASKGLLDRLRKMSGLTLDGTGLLTKIFNLKQPVLFIRGNRLETQDEKDQYFAVASLLKTIVYMYRNPKAHQLKLYDETKLSDAVTAFVMMSEAHKLIDNLMNAQGWDV